jgi:hypothetical protein
MKTIFLQIFYTIDARKPAGSCLLPDETVPHPTRLESGTSDLPFASLTLHTTKHCDRYMHTVAPIIDFVMF